MPDQHSENEIKGALGALTTLSPDLCVPLPPRRISLGEAKECLVQWQPAGAAGEWRLSLTKRSESIDDTDFAPQTFQASIDPANQRARFEQAGSDTPFFAWVGEHLADIAADTRARQAKERVPLMARAQVSSRAFAIWEYIPHIVILIALAAFAYMFAIVHIKF